MSALRRRETWWSRLYIDQKLFLGLYIINFTFILVGLIQGWVPSPF